MKAYSISSRLEAMNQERRFFALRYLPENLAVSNQLPKLKQLLLSFEFIHHKIQVTGPLDLLNDFEFVFDDKSFERIHSAISNAMYAHDLGIELGGQLWARLLSFRETDPNIGQLLRAITESPLPQLLLQQENLPQAGGILVRTTNAGGVINAMGLTQDGAYLVTAHGSAMDPEYVIKVWDWRTGQHIRTLEARDTETAHTDEVKALIVQGNHAFSGSMDGTIKIWHWAEGHLVRTLALAIDNKDDDEPAYPKSLGIYGDYLLNGWTDGFLSIWNWKTGELLITVQCHKDEINSIVIRGEHIFTASDDGTIGIWAIVDSKTQPGSEAVYDIDLAEMRTLKNPVRSDGQHAYVTTIALNGAMIIAGQDDEPIKMWNWHSGQLVHKLDETSEGIIATATLENWLWTGGYDRKVCLWNLQTGQLESILGRHSAAVSSVQVTSDRIITAGYDRVIKIWRRTESSASGSPLSANQAKNSIVPVKTFGLEAHDDFVRSLRIVGDHLFSGSHDGTVKVWRWPSGELIRTLSPPLTTEPLPYITCMQVVDDLCFVGSADETVRIFDYRSAQLVGTLGDSILSFDDAEWIRTLLVVGKYCLTGASDGKIRVWDWQKSELVKTFGMDPTEIQADWWDINEIVVSGEHIIAASDEPIVRVWNWHTGQLVNSFEHHTDTVDCIQIMGNLVATGSHDRTIKIWNWCTGEVAHTLEAHSELIRTMDVSGNYLVSGAYDQSIKVWNWRTGELKAALALDSFIHAVQFSPCMKYVVAGDAEGGIHQLRLLNVGDQ